MQGCRGSKGVRGCLQTPVGWVLENTPRLTLLQVPPEPLPGSASAGSTATPAGRAPPCGAGLPLRPGSPAGESLLAGLATERTSCRIRKCRSRGVSPSGGPRPFRVAVPGPNAALYTQDTDRGSALGQPKVSVGAKEQDNGP